MKEIQVKKYVRIVFGIAFILFLLNKLYLRPWILENEGAEQLQLISYSIPNFIEAIFGTFIGTGILYFIRGYFKKRIGQLKDVYIHVIAVSFAAIYVISQELKIHNIGGNNVFDVNDIIASILGLLATFISIQIFGFAEKTK